jgi:hypothetical protein
MLMTHVRLFAAVGCALVLAGCGRDADREQDREPPPVKDTAFGDMAGTMDKARAVQDTVDAHKNELDEQLKSQEGQSEP